MSHRKGLTLLEMLLLLTILAVFSSVVVPEMTSASTDVRDSQLIAELRTVRNLLSQYRRDHGNWPGGEQFVAQMTLRTNRQGEVLRLGQPHERYPFGPYLHSVPANPYVPRSVAAKVQVGTDAPGGGEAGWHYNPKTGHFCPDDDAHAGR